MSLEYEEKKNRIVNWQLVVFDFNYPADKCYRSIPDVGIIWQLANRLFWRYGGVDNARRALQLCRVHTVRRARNGRGFRTRRLNSVSGIRGPDVVGISRP